MRKTLWYFVKILLIAVGVMIVWAAMVVAGLVLAAFGARRRRTDASAIAMIVSGAAITMLAWPLTFSSSGLLGALAPESGVKPQAVPIVLHGVGAAVVVAIVRALSGRKARRVMRAPVSAPPVPMSAPPPLPGLVRYEPAPAVTMPSPAPVAAEPPAQAMPSSGKNSRSALTVGARKRSAKGLAPSRAKRGAGVRKPGVAGKRPVTRQAGKKEPARVGSKRKA